MTLAYHCIFACAFQRIRGTAESLYVLTKANDTRFEFIFTNLVCTVYIHVYVVYQRKLHTVLRLMNFEPLAIQSLFAPNVGQRITVYSLWKTCINGLNMSLLSSCNNFMFQQIKTQWPSSRPVLLTSLRHQTGHLTRLF